MSETISVELLATKIAKLKQQFITDVTELAKKIEIPVEITIQQRDNNSFFRSGDRHPFDIKINPVDCHNGLPFVFGGITQSSLP